MAMSVGQMLINHHIPKQYQIKGKASAKDIDKALDTWAKNDPKSYANNIPYIKRVSDDVTLYEGLSVGLDDLNPMVKERQDLLRKYEPRFNKAKTVEEQKKILAEAASYGGKLAVSGKGSLVDMYKTGAKGNPTQVMKNILTPLAAREPDGTPYPFIIKKNYAEGLSSSEYWVAAQEARNNAVETKLSTSIPGDFGKQLFNALNNLVVTTNDCKTDNGIDLSVDDTNCLDRYLSRDIVGVGRRNTLVTTIMLSAAKKKRINTLFVRSPMTCEAKEGVCQKCYGLNPAGKLHNIGANVGTLAAQALSEPLTQMAISSKHGGKASSIPQEEVGMKGVSKLLAKPKVFSNKAALATLDGKVTKISKADQGGYFIYVNDVEHYVAPTNNVLVKIGQRVIKGDTLSSGLKDPRELTNLRGLGSGRQYMINALYNAYNPIDPDSGKRTGLPVDKRNLEILAKKDMNHVVVEDHNDTFTKGDVVNYNKIKSYMEKSKEELPLSKAVGRFLGKEYFHFTVGTEITPRVISDLRARGVNTVFVTKRKINFSPHVTNLRQIPLLKDNFIARMTHSEIKNTLRRAATEGEESDLAGYDPIPSFIQGIAFGEGTDGRY